MIAINLQLETCEFNYLHFLISLKIKAFKVTKNLVDQTSDLTN